ncbi:glycosyltransferase [Flavobacterium silvisoli]|uniref:Glycosyltransferase n=1 Tax=Flavobacterium silvisoli TaxID=2529433 RepID=A0A4Q9YS01_9FLAO|nr:glycosyltransferase family 4 protein [Flavobacterium silvisoli]TBX66360.1 glycosyltransferase [Flavobacterium silvisoli]
MSDKKKKIAFFGLPLSGGNYTHYCYLKHGLKDFEFSLIGVGKIDISLICDSSFIHLGNDLDKNKDQTHLAKIVFDYIENAHFDIIIPMNSPIVVSLIPFLNEKTRIVQIVNSDTPRVYKYVTSHIEYVDQIICISSKQMQEIEKRIPFDFFNSNVSLIPHGVTLDDNDIKYNDNGILCLGYLGRMHQGHKNIFLLPEILKKLSIPYEFELVGGGEDKALLLEKLNNENIIYKDHGNLDKEDINKAVKDWDIQLFPSTVEGFGLTIIECMNQGVVPVANRLKGVTDYIITNQIDGYLIDNNDVTLYVDRIMLLHSDRNLLKALKHGAKNTVKNRFDLATVLNQYNTVFTGVLQKTNDKLPLDFSAWKPYVEYKPSLLKRILNKF